MAARRAKADPEWFDIPAFPIPIYGGKTLLCVTKDEWASVAEAYGGDPDAEACKGLTIRYLNDEGRTYVIGVFDRTIDTFTHELAHVTFFLLHDVGIPVENGEANEAYAYAIGFLMREILPVYLNTINS